MKRVLALDPGDRVGWASASIDAKGEWSDVDHGITELKLMAMVTHDALVNNDAYDIVVVERWALYRSHALKLVGSEIPSAQFIGMVKQSCWLAGVPCVMQDARDVNSHTHERQSVAEASMMNLRPELFEQVTQPITHDEGHDLVALKHLWLYTFRNYPVERLDV